MKIPQAPPLEERTVQFLTKTADRAIRSKSGPLYRCLVDALQRCNPGCFDTQDEVGEYLQRYAWPPVEAEMIFEDFPHLPEFPASLDVKGRSTEILITDPQALAAEVRLRAALKSGFKETYGGTAQMSSEKRRILATGCSTEEFDRIVGEALENIHRTVNPWIGFRDVASAICRLPTDAVAAFFRA